MIAINGLGRIGRIAARILAVRHPQLLWAINDPADLRTAVHLLRYDSVHGDDHPVALGTTTAYGDHVRLAEREVPFFHVPDPTAIPWPAEVRLVVEASGRFTDRAGAARHLRGNVGHVVISAPSPDPDFTAIHPFNGHLLDLERHRVISNASCTAHATAPVLDVLHRTFRHEAAGMGTVHVATNDQRLLDAPHKDLRRARAAFVGIHPTSSSAFAALRQALPWLPAGFDGWAYRVPTLNVNLLDLSALLPDPTTAQALNAAFREAATGRLAGILGIADAPLVSVDFKGRPESVVMDLDLTQVAGDRLVRVCGWHDNETAYAERLCELVVAMAGQLA